MAAQGFMGGNFDLTIAREGMLPRMGNAAIAGASDKTNGNAWYGGIAGTWTALAQIKDISFVEDLSHIVKVVYYQGTNNKEMVRNKTISDPQESVGSMIYLTTGDKAVEVNLDTEYKIYKDLSMFLELGYIRLDMDEDLWKGVGYEANKNNLKAAVSVRYMF